MPVPSEIFKAYDVRGLYGEQIDEDVAEQVGRGFARVIADLSGKPAAELRLGLGRDMRLTAPALAARYSAGMQAEGAHVLDVGQVGTEMLYFLVGSRELDGGLMCTASHNPPQYTGAKLVREGAIALSGDSGIQDIRRMVQDGMPDPTGGGSSEDVDISADFRKGAMAFIDPANVKPMKVVADGGNGMGGTMVGPLLDQLPLDLVKTYWTPDGNFPDRQPNPMLEENRRFIVETVLSEGADLGIAWDGDADRCFFIDDTGRFVDGDFLTAVLAEHLLASKPGSDILYDARASRAVPDTVRRAGGTPHINRVGHAFFKTRMRDEGAIFGGEVSGHYYFHDFYNADSGTIPALLILEKLSVEGVKMSQLLEPYRSTYFISGEINSEVSDAQAKMALIEERYSDGTITHVDGVSVDYDDWHFNVRASNTEPLLRLTLESLVSPEDMERRRDEVLGLIPLLTDDGDADELHGRAADAGVHRIAVPTPFAVGRVNCWLIEDSPLTLIDVGPNAARSLDVLERGLARFGHGIEDLELIVLSHQHLDHTGMAGLLAERSGAEVAALGTLAPWLGDHGKAVEEDDVFATEIMREHGIPDDVRLALRGVSASFRGWGGSVQVTRPLEEGSVLRLRDRELHVHHRPGHSPSDIVLHDRSRGILIAADHLIRHISSNPLISRPLGEGPEAARPHALETYLASMRETQAMEDVSLVLTGHGDPIADPVALIDERFRGHDRRKGKILGLIAEQPRTAYEIAGEIWGDVAVTQAYLTLSEVIGHVDLLVADGRVEARRDAGVTVWHAV